MLKKVLISLSLHILWFAIMGISMLMTYSLKCPAICEFIATDHPLISMIMFTVIVNLLIILMNKAEPFQSSVEREKFHKITCIFTVLMWVPYILPMVVVFVSVFNQ